MTKFHDPQSGRIKKLVSRLLHHSSNLHDTSPDDSDADSGIATPKWLGSYRATPSASSSFSAPKAYGRDTSISLDLWNSAYNSLRDSLSSAGLVTVYESILCQELPNNQSIGGINQSLPRSDDERLRSLITITESGLKKCRTKTQADDQAKALIRASRKIIKSVWADYPSTAVAWSGICILTPLLLGATIAIEDMRRGAIHVLGRIPWYMHLSELILGSAWKSDADFYTQRDRTREKLLKLYRKVLEFEMNCVCAAASSWNNAAKNVVGWHKLGAMVREIEELDAEISNLITSYIDRGVADSIRRYNEDLKLDAKDEGPCPFGDGSSSTAPSSAPSSAPFQLDASHAADAMTEVKHSTVRV